MYRIATLAMTSLLASPPSATAPARPAPNAETVIELRSYGEYPRDMIELLVPFVARLEFAEVRITTKSPPGVAAAAFVAADGDFLIVTGRFNCIVVAYFARWPYRTSRGPTARDRADSFRAELDGFLARLPTPRLDWSEVIWGENHCQGMP